MLYAASSSSGFGLLLPREPVAPPLMWSEALSVLHETLRRQAITSELAKETRQRLLATEIARVVPDALYAQAWSIAQQLGWAKTYDAEYVALARILECPLFTVDARLRRGAGHLVAMIGPDDLRATDQPH